MSCDDLVPNQAARWRKVFVAATDCVIPRGTVQPALLTPGARAQGRSMGSRSRTTIGCCTAAGATARCACGQLTWAPISSCGVATCCLCGTLLLGRGVTGSPARALTGRPSSGARACQGAMIDESCLALPPPRLGRLACSGRFFLSLGCVPNGSEAVCMPCMPSSQEMCLVPSGGEPHNLHLAPVPMRCAAEPADRERVCAGATSGWSACAHLQGTRQTWTRSHGTPTRSC